jgi:hypothetical protein
MTPSFYILSSLLCRLRPSIRVANDLCLALQDLPILVCTSGIDPVDPSLVEEDEEDNVIPETGETVHCGNEVEFSTVVLLESEWARTPWHVDDETCAVIDDGCERFVYPAGPKNQRWSTIPTEVTHMAFILKNQ